MTFLADPSEVERVLFETCPRLADKYQHVEDFHWAVRPLAVAVGVFTVMKVGVFVGRNVGAKMKKGGRRNRISGDGEGQDGQSGGNVGWRRSKVANMIFREGGGASTAAAR